MQGSFSGGGDYRMENIQVTYLGPRTATVTYAWSWSGDTPVGIPFKITGRGTKVIVHDDGGLKMRLIHLNQDTVHVGGLKVRSQEDQQAVLEHAIPIGNTKFDAIAGRYVADGEMTLEFYREEDQAFVRMVETKFVGPIVAIAPNHYVLVAGHDVAYRFTPAGAQAYELESQLGPRISYYKVHLSE